MIAAAEVLRQVRDPDPVVRERAVRAGSATLPLDTLVQHLRNGADHVLRNAALEMLKGRGAEAGALATSLLGDADADVVLQAVLLLDHLKDPRTVEPLRRVLRHPGPNIVQAAIVALGHVGNASVIPDLAGFLGSDLWLRMAAVEALGNLRSADAVAPLAGMLDDELLGSTAAESIARIGGAEAFRVLASRWVAHQADASLLELVALVLEGLPGGIPAVPSFGIALEVTMQAASAAALHAAARCMLAMGPGAGDMLALELLSSTPGDTLLPACLLRRGDLIGALLEKGGAAFGWGLRLAALRPRDVPPGALPAAMQRMKGHAFADVMGDALLAVEPDLDQLGESLVRLYQRLPHEVRLAWGAVLRRHHSVIRTALLDAALADAGTRIVLSTVTEERAAAAAAAIAALPVELRAEALSHATERDDVLALLPWPRLLETDAEGCGRMAVAVCERAMLSRHVAEIRSLAERKPHRELIRLLGRLKDGASVPMLAAIAEQGPDTMRPFALTALGAIGGEQARLALRDRAASETTWARFAFRALADCRVEADLPVFRLAAAHADWHVRMVSAEVLSASRCPEDRALLAGLAADPAQAVADRARAGLVR